MRHGMAFVTFLAGMATVATISPADAFYIHRCNALRHETDVSRLEAAVKARDRCSCAALQRLIELTHPRHFDPGICEPGSAIVASGSRDDWVDAS